VSGLEIGDESKEMQLVLGYWKDLYKVSAVSLGKGLMNLFRWFSFPTVTSVNP
jgi:hypothetical protein